MQVYVSLIYEVNGCSVCFGKYWSMRFNKFHIVLLSAAVFCLSVCVRQASAQSHKRSSTKAASKPHNNDTTQDDDYEDMYVVIADTGQSYFKLREEMVGISKRLHYPIDTMNRYYNAKKNEIVLSESDEDELYRGEYFQRRYASESLSLEYYKSYNNKSSVKNIAIVSGIFSNRKKADSSLAVLRRSSARAFRIKSHIYMGCMH